MGLKVLGLGRWDWEFRGRASGFGAEGVGLLRLVFGPGTYILI